jgi:MFS family permease
MTSASIPSAIGPRGFFVTPSYVRLWFAGGVGNSMRWLELLVAGIFTYDVTHSTFLVAVVTVARSLPMLFVGAIAGVIGEALNRKRLLVAQLFVMATSSAVLYTLALSGQIRVGHVAVGDIITGIVWATELAVRRRMIGEVVMPGQVGPAVAFDSLTNSIARVLGPIAGGAVFQILALGGAYFLSAALSLAAGLVVAGLDFRQEPRKLRFGRIPADIAERLPVARTNPAILTVVLVSIIMNAFAFSYSALIAPIGLDGYGVSPILVGALAAAEQLGAIATGISLSAGWLRLDGRRALLRRSFLFVAGLGAMALSPWYALAFVVLLIGGLGAAAFLEYADDRDSHRGTADNAIPCDGNSHDVYRHRAAGRAGDRRVVRTARSLCGDFYHGLPWPRGIEPGLGLAVQDARIAAFALPQDSLAEEQGFEPSVPVRENNGFETGPVRAPRTGVC